MSGSISHWILQLQAGNRDAVRPIWERYYRRLVGLARSRLSGVPRGMADEEDVVVMAFDSFCRGAEAGRFPDLHDRHGLWAILVLITARKASSQATYEKRQKRSAGANGRISGTTTPEEIAANDPTPEFCAQAAEAYRELLASLANPTLQDVAVWKMEGYTNDEIAAKLGCSTRTLERKLGLIRAKWMLKLYD